MYLGIPPRLHEDHVDGLNMVQIAGPLTMHFPDHELCKSVHPLMTIKVPPLHPLRGFQWCRG